MALLDQLTYITCLHEILKAFQKNLFVGKLTKIKVAPIGQAIMQSVRPRILNLPLQLGLGVQMQRQFGSRFLCFCSSYSEIQI